MKNNTKKTNNVPRRDFLKNAAALSATAIILPNQILKGQNNKLPNNQINTSTPAVAPAGDNGQRPSFLNKPYPVIAGIFSGQTPSELIVAARNSEFEGAGGIAIDLCDFKPEFRNAESFEKITGSVHLPFMFYFYRDDKWEKLNDDDRQDVLLTAAGAGASMIDVMGDLYDPSDNEITYSKKAIDKQKQLIDKIHDKGADVVISSHTNCYLTTEQVVEHLQEVEKRGADVVKIVTKIDTEEELAEALQTTIVLNKELKTPFIHLCGGKYSRPHRFMCPVLGTSILFAVPQYIDKYPGFFQPTIRAMKAVLDNVHWNIHDIG